MALCWSLDKVGPICRFVEDTAIVLAAINGADGADRSSIDAPFHFDAEADIAGLKLGYLPEAFGEGATEVDHAALAAARRLGVEVVEVSLPDLPYEALMNMVYAEAAAAFEELTLSDLDDTLKWQDDGAWPNTFRKARFLSAVDHVQLDRLRYQVMLALDELFSKVDAVIGPFMTGPMLIASNFTGHPCLHLRAGFLRARDARRSLARLGQADDGRARSGGSHLHGPSRHIAVGAAVRGGSDPQSRHGARAGARRRRRSARTFRGEAALGRRTRSGVRTREGRIETKSMRPESSFEKERCHEAQRFPEIDAPR